MRRQAGWASSERDCATPAAQPPRPAAMPCQPTPSHPATAGGASYWGRRAFERHFREWQHENGMRALGIPNSKKVWAAGGVGRRAAGRGWGALSGRPASALTHRFPATSDPHHRILLPHHNNPPQFFEVTQIVDAVALWKSLQERGGGGEAAEEEFEDEQGNVYNRKTWEDLRRQGLV